MPEAIIFDLDGTLADTETVWDGIRQGLAEEAGVEWPTGATRAMMGMSTREWSTYLAEEVGLPFAPDEVAKLTIDKMAQHYREGVTLLPGAVESVRRMAAHYLVGIASSSPRVLIDAFVDVLGISDLIQVSVSTEEVERGKPAPDGFIKACALLGVEPGAAIAIEDSTNGIVSALAAGMTVIAVPPHFHPPSRELLARTTVLESLDELTTDLVEELVASADAPVGDTGGHGDLADLPEL